MSFQQHFGIINKKKRWKETWTNLDTASGNPLGNQIGFRFLGNLYIRTYDSSSLHCHNSTLGWWRNRCLRLLVENMPFLINMRERRIKHRLNIVKSTNTVFTRWLFYRHPGRSGRLLENMLSCTLYRCRTCCRSRLLLCRRKAHRTVSGNHRNISTTFPFLFLHLWGLCIHCLGKTEIIH